ncbi:DNA polymerase IV [Ornithinicoccus hortensis]|uniref:DNA polymerase IV n=2 Tax=Ornithinicoccus hortensis TaxID=82346 RepID=A0A542YSX1_9MICO|nr:DNA polymerase-4 [Ornithinicoccus hortensis]
MLWNSGTMPSVHPQASVLHLDLDAFFAAVEQRDKPSLRGKPVVVGGTGGRGVVSTASYEARVFGARSAMPTAEARRRCPPGTAFLGGRFDAYRMTSRVVMDLLREVSPVLEQVSVDEAFLDLTAATDVDFSTEGLTRLGEDLMARIKAETGGLTASVGIATSKMMAKLGSEMRKPAGLTVIAPGTEEDVLHPMSVRAVPGVGPATGGKLHAFGVETVGDLARVSREDLVSIFGEAHGGGLYRLARARDERLVTAERETKSVSVEETFETDIADRDGLDTELEALVRRLTARLSASAYFGRTITVKVRQHDFTQLTRSGTLAHATGEGAVILREARRLLATIDISSGLRLLGVGVSGLTAHAQEELLGSDLVAGPPVPGPVIEYPDSGGNLDPQGDGATELDRVAVIDRRGETWGTGQDVVHEEFGPGWVWGAGRGRVSVRFEGPLTPPGRVRTFDADDPALQRGEPPDWRPSTANNRP